MYYESGDTAVHKPYLATFYDEWGQPLSSEGTYVSSPGMAAKMQAEMDAKIHQEKMNQYAPGSGNTPLSGGDAAAAQDAQQQANSKQQNDLYSKIIALLGGSSSSSLSGGSGWTPGSTNVLEGNNMGNFSDALGGGAGSGHGGTTGPKVGGGIRQGSTGQLIANGSPMMGNRGSQPGAMPYSQAPQQQAAPSTQMSTNHSGTTEGVNAMQQAQSNQLLDTKNWSPMALSQAQASWRAGQSAVGPNGGLYGPPKDGTSYATAANSTNQSGMAGATGDSGASGSTGAGAGAGAGAGDGSFGSQYEKSLYSAFTNPGYDPEPIINKGTDEIAQGESNSLIQLGNRAANQGVEGGAVQAGNREVLSDFAGKRADLARTTRSDAAKDAEANRMSALNTAGNYLGRVSDNARADRNQQIQLLLQQMQNQQNNQTDYSGLAGTSGQRPSFAPVAAGGGGGSGGSTFGSNGFASAFKTGGTGGVYNPQGGLQAYTTNAANNRKAAAAQEQGGGGAGGAGGPQDPGGEQNPFDPGSGSFGGGLMNGPNKGKSLADLNKQGWTF